MSFLKLFFVVDYLQYRLPYGHQRVLVYHVHGVVRGVPEVAEARVALRVVVDDVHAGYLAQVVDIEVVIRHFRSVFLGEESFKSQAVGGVPDLFYLLARRALGEKLLVESGVLAAHHVEQDAEAGACMAPCGRWGCHSLRRRRR